MEVTGYRMKSCSVAPRFKISQFHDDYSLHTHRLLSEEESVVIVLLLIWLCLCNVMIIMGQTLKFMTCKLLISAIDRNGLVTWKGN